MTTRARLLALSTALAVLLSVLLASTGTADAVTSRHTPTVHIYMKVAGCKGCTIEAVWGASTKQDPMWTSRVRSGEASFTVPRAKTKGLLFTIYGTVPGAIGNGAAPVAVLLDKGHKVGRPLSAKGAAKAKWGSGCWAGTSRKKVSLSMRVVLYRTWDYTHTRKVKAARLFMVTGVAKSGPWKRLYRGALETQDAAGFCS